MNLLALLKTTDVYLFDQILKERYKPGCRILDAGCGNGRNLPWFVDQRCHVTGTDRDSDAITFVSQRFKEHSNAHFIVAEGVALPFAKESFNHVLSSAVLHFAQNHTEFKDQFSELVRVLVRGGTLFIRMTTNIGIEHLVLDDDGLCRLPDGSRRYLLTVPTLNIALKQHALEIIEPLKSVVVAGQRSMGVIVLQKL